MKLARPSLEAWFNRYQPGATHQLGGTMIAPLPGPRLAELLPATWSPSWLDTGYTSTPGSETLRLALASSEGLGPEHVILTAGASEANAAVLMALLCPRSAVVLQDPLYYQFEALATGLGAEVRRWMLPADPFEAPDLAALDALLDEKTRLVVLNTPHNPTGRVLSEDTLRAIAARIETLPECYLLVDEIYRGVTLPQPPSITALTARGIAVNAVSKRWSLPGLRLGWVMSQDETVLKRILAWHEHMSCSISRVSEQMIEWLWPKRAVIWEEHAAIAARNRRLVADWLAGLERHATGVLPPAGVMTLVWPLHVTNDQDLAIQVREAFDCFVVPGSFVGYPGALRVGFGHRDEAVLEAALTQLGKALSYPVRRLR